MMITSTSNPKIKNLIRLKKARERKKQDFILVEGEDEIKLAIDNGFELKELYIKTGAPKLEYKDVEFFEVAENIFKRISYREHPENLLAVFKSKYLELENLKLSKSPLLVVLEGIEKPGNLGAILRTADVAGVDAVIVNDPKLDIYNPNVIRASRGGIFTNQLVLANVNDTVKYLKENKIKTFAAALTAKKNYTKINFKKPCAIVLGTEADGLSKKWLENADQLIKIPMKGSMDSLNVSVSVAVVLFEAIRQREFYS